VPYHPLRLELSKEQKRELLLFMKRTCDKEEYRRIYAVKQKMEGVPYRTIANDMGVNYRSVYDWIDNYRKFGLDGIRNKRNNNGGRRPVISTVKNKEMIKDIVLNKSPRTFGYLKNTWSIRLLSIYLSSLLGMNVSPKQTWRIIHDLGIVYKQPKLELKKEKDDDYEEKKGKIDKYRKVSRALLKKDTTRI
jgi:putative transposase